MTGRTPYLITLLEQLGTPLAISIMKASDGQKGDAQNKTTAQNMAGLLAKSIELSIEMGRSADLADISAQNDAVRVALAALGGQMIAGRYGETGTISSETDIKNMSEAVQAVLTFADNFTFSDENAARLQALKANAKAFDPAQHNIQYIDAFVPVIEALSRFQFGQAIETLIPETAQRLTTHVRTLRHILIDEHDLQSPEQGKLLDLVFLKSVCKLYAASHTQETARIGKEGANADINTVWAFFETQLEMVKALIFNLDPSRQSKHSTEAQGSVAPQANPVQATPSETPLEAPLQPPNEAIAKPPTPPIPAQPKDSEDARAQNQSSGSPLSFFKKPPPDAQNGDT